MKTIQIGELKVQVCEELKDISAIRYRDFREMVIRAFEEADVPTILAYEKAMIDAFNSRELYKPIATFQAFIRASKRKAVGSLDLALSLITLIDGENPLNVDANHHTEKIETLYKAGMSADVPAREVYFFIKKHPIEFRGFGEIIQILSEMLTTEEQPEQSSEK